MANTEDLSNEQIISLLQMLFTNMNNLDKLYYDMFINNTPLTLTLERYNEDGVLETYELPNRAKDRTSMLQGRGDPNMSQAANIGTFYLDILTSNVWVKALDNSSSGWIKLYTPANFVQGKEYLAPTGDGSGLTGLSATNLQGGILSVLNGGTGTAGLNGIIMGRGGNVPYTTAVAKVDYAIPDTFIGMLGLFMCPDDAYSTIPSGWLLADGSYILRSEYPKLAEKLYPTGHQSSAVWPNNTLTESGNKQIYTNEYGETVEVPLNSVVFPNYQNRYIRGWDGTGTLGTFQASALPNIKGKGCFWYSGNAEAYKNKVTGALYVDTEVTNDYRDVNDNATGNNGYPISFDASRYHPVRSGVQVDSIYKDDVYEARVNNLTANVFIFAGE